MIEMKKKLLFFVFFFILGVSCCSLFFQDSKSSATRYVVRNQAELEAFVETLRIDPPINGSTSYRGWDVAYWRDSGVAEFIVKRWGIVPDAAYQGFYFSPEDRPIGFQSSDIDLVTTEDGWFWEEKGGDNWQQIERIVERWYWVEAHF